MFSKLKHVSLETYIAIFITIRACITRLSMAIGQISYVLAILLTGILIYKQRHTYKIPTYVKKYAKAYGIMLLFLLPSVLFTGNISVSFPEFFNVWIWRIPVFAIIVLGIKNKNTLLTMLAIFLLVFGIDSLVAFIQPIIGYVPRGYGFGSSPLTIAGIMVMMTPVMLVALWDSVFPNYVKQSSLFALFSMFFGMHGNQSRGSWIFTLLLFPFASWQYIWAKKKYLILSLAVIATVIALFASQPFYVAKFYSIANTTTDGSNLGRFDVWQSSVNMFKDHPLIGVGIGQWRDYYELMYRLPRETQHLYHAHSNFFQLISEVGAIGFIGVVGFYLFLVIDSFKNWMKDKNPYDLAACGAIIGYIFLFGQFEYTLDNSSGLRIMYFILGILWQLKYISYKS